MTGLIPVSEWKWTLYAIRYMDQEGGSTLKVDSIVSNQVSIEELSEHAPPRCEWIEWEVIEDNVPEPRQEGIWRGFPIYENGWTAARRYDR